MQNFLNDIFKFLNKYRQKHFVEILRRTTRVSHNISYLFYVIKTYIIRYCIIILIEYISRLNVLYHYQFNPLSTDGTYKYHHF